MLRINIKEDSTLERTYYVHIGNTTQGYTFRYNEQTKELYAVHWYEGVDEEAKLVQVNMYDLSAILKIMKQYGYILEKESDKEECQAPTPTS